MILLTGASGFVGGALATRLQGKKAYRAVLRSPCEAPFSAGSHQVFYGDLSAAQDWREAVHDVDCVLHCAARVHVMDDRHSGRHNRRRAPPLASPGRQRGHRRRPDDSPR
ncbi:MAG: NAD-dependent epimerase/dehydratase family protein [Elusimicrobia bacterium]|nr:MAG: NAD-dependent epimerase/dehydratase family protein [Elusimicrobiota bacterium]